MDRNGSKSPRQWFAEAEAGRRFVAALFSESPDDDEVVDPLWPQIPNYRLFRKLASGGGGNVYLAIKKGYTQPCALKVLKQDIRDTSLAQRAWRELDVLQRLQLPFIPRVLDFGVHEGRLFIASEYIEGLALDEHCRANSLSLRQRVELLVALAGRVQQLHEQGVLHRDLKPSNLIVDKYGAIHILDFGIAQVLSEDDARGLTLQGQILGSAAYMSPEQAKGDRQAVSTRSDVYALSAIAYVILTGGTPHPSGHSRHELIQHVATQPARDPLKLDSSLPKPLAAILEKGASHAPGDRFASAQALCEELQRWLNNEPIRSMRIGPLRRAMLAARRRPAMSALVTASIVVGVAALYLGAIAYLNGQQADRIEALKDHQDTVMLNTVTLAATSLAQGKHEQALKALAILDSFEESGLTNEQVLEQIKMTRRDFCTTVVAAAYDCEDVDDLPHSAQLKQVLEDIEESDVLRR